jgi:hypothetical protein
MVAEEDRKQIGLTPASIETMNLLTSGLGWFAEGQIAGRFALAVAVRAGVAPGVTAGVETRWSPDLFDPTEDIRRLLKAKYPDITMPVRLMEHFVNEGFAIVRRRYEAGDTKPIEFLG